MACKRSGVRIPVAPQLFPGQTPISSPPRQPSRSSDRHLTVVVGGMNEHRVPWPDRRWHPRRRRSQAWLNSCRLGGEAGEVSSLPAERGCALRPRSAMTLRGSPSARAWRSARHGKRVCVSHLLQSVVSQRHPAARRTAVRHGELCMTAPSITRAEQGDRRLCQRAVVHDVRTAQEQKSWASRVRTVVVVVVPERLTHSMSAWAPSPSGP